mmetsp:Transcript_6444/g.18689  ORF Transcript_6444/g.18689 Transcript_6444/m.18689 type:complete len:237 (-) Transcript_6444:715-1425(-)
MLGALPWIPCSGRGEPIMPAIAAGAAAIATKKAFEDCRVGGEGLEGHAAEHVVAPEQGSGHLGCALGRQLTRGEEEAPSCALPRGWNEVEWDWRQVLWRGQTPQPLHDNHVMPRCPRAVGSHALRFLRRSPQSAFVLARRELCSAATSPATHSIARPDTAVGTTGALQHPGDEGDAGSVHVCSPRGPAGGSGEVDVLQRVHVEGALGERARRGCATRARSEGTSTRGPTALAHGGA